MVLLFLKTIFFVDEIDDKRHDLEVLIILLDFVFAVEIDFHLTFFVDLDPEFFLLLVLFVVLFLPGFLHCVVILFEIGRAHII